MNPRLLLRLVFLVLAAWMATLTASQSSHAAGPWYVAPSGNDGNDCLGSTTACATINGALNKSGFVAGDTILVATGVYTGTGSEVALLNKNATLSGGWKTDFSSRTGETILDGNGARRGIYVNSGVAITVEHFVIENCFVTSSDWGGGIYNNGTLTIDSSNIRSNQGGGIYTVGTLTMTSSSVVNNTGRGGIYKDVGTLTLNNSTIASNTAGHGGGIYVGNPGSVSINNSTITRNSATNTGGGGVGNAYPPELVTLRNTILAGNIPSDCQGQLTLAGYNILGSSNGCTLITSATDRINLDPALGSQIGSPAYYPLLLASPAINAGDPTGCKDHLGNLLATDQRGVPRVGRCDIGTYEYTPPGPAALIYTFAGTPQHTPLFRAFGVSLQAVVLDSIGSPVNNSTVTFFAPTSEASGTFSNTGTITTTAVTNESGIATAATFIANGQNGSYVVTATVSGVVTTVNFLLSNLGWYVSPSGNDAHDCQTPTTACATINSALNKPGFVSGDIILVVAGVYTGTGTEVVLLNKSVTLSGGWDAGFITQSGISTIDGQGVRRGVSVQMSVIAVVERFAVQNGAGYGGGIRNDGALTLDISAVRSNRAYDGGGIYNYYGTLILNNSAVSGNTADGSGGGIYNTSGGMLTLNNSTISDNIANEDGGGIHSDYSTVTLNNTTISNNNAADEGGGIYSFAAGVVLQNTVLAENTAPWGADCYRGHPAYPVSSAGYNLFGDISWCAISLTTGDLTNVVPRLGPLEGSPGYHPLLPGSPAIDAGNPTGCKDQLGNLLTTDQRGKPRLDRCDIGAYEVQRSLSVTKRAEPNPVSPGAQLTYTLYVTNTGDVTLTATITDILPTQVTLGETSDESAILSGGMIIWTPIITVPGGIWTETVVVTVAMDYAGPLTNVIQVTSEEGATGIYTHTLAPSLDINKQVRPDPVQAGKQLTYTIQVTNTGNFDLHTTLTDILPSHVSPSGMLVWTPTITVPGGIWIKTVVVTVEVGYSGLLTNVVEVATLEGPAAIYTKTSTAFVPHPAVEVTKLVDPDPVQAGAPLTYTIHVTNTGDVTLNGTVTDTLPAHITPTGVQMWELNNLTPTDVWTKTVVVTVTMGYAGPLTNVVQVTTEEGVTGIYTATTQAWVTPALTVTKQANSTTVRAGERVTYTIRITNTGNITLTGIVTDTLPAKVTPTGSQTWTLTNLSPGNVWIQPLVVTVTRGYSGTLINRVEVTTQEGARGETQVSVNAIGYQVYFPIILK